VDAFYFNALQGLGLILVGLWDFIKYLLRKNGRETHLFWGHWGDIQNLGRMAANAEDETSRRRYRSLLAVFYVLLALVLLVSLLWAFGSALNMSR